MATFVTNGTQTSKLDERRAHARTALARLKDAFRYAGFRKHRLDARARGGRLFGRLVQNRVPRDERRSRHARGEQMGVVPRGYVRDHADGFELDALF